MVYNVLNFIFIIFSIFNCLYYTYGAVWKSFPEIPHKNIEKSCEGWILHYGFIDDVKKNRKMALNRDKTYDQEVSVWAATYAYLMSSFNELSLELPNCCSPSEFCERYDYSQKENSFLALKNAEMTCDEWIYFYGYSRDKSSINFFMAYDRKKHDDHIIHIWVAMYSRYIQKFQRADIQPSEFCWNMGKFFTPEPKKMPFVTLDTKLSCKEWIELSDYTTDVEYNIQKAFVLNRKFEDYLSKWTILYVYYLKVIDSLRSTNGFYVKSSDPKPLTPDAYCNSIDQPFDDKVHYDEEIIN